MSPKEHFTTMAREQLPRTTGEKYTSIVVDCLNFRLCLTCMDEDNEDELRIQIGVKFIEKVG
jgi:hypothetical protein